MVLKTFNRKQYIINKKISQIIENPHHFKPLRGDMMVQEECTLTNLSCLYMG